MQVVLPLLLITTAHTPALPARHQTANFVVDAEAAEVAQLVAESAERRRAELAESWFGKKLPDWSHPCRIAVEITMDGPRAVTDMEYAQKKVVKHRIEMSGAADEILSGPLPHELTHVLLGHHFGTQAPRWVDEGAALLSEGGDQGDRQRRAFDRILAEKKHFALRQLLGMREYPRDLRCLYAQGHSLVRFLVAAKDRNTLLAFVRTGLADNWDEAVRKHFGYQDVDQLESAWLAALEKERSASAHFDRIVTPSCANMMFTTSPGWTANERLWLTTRPFSIQVAWTL